MHCLSTFFYVELKFGPLEKRVKMTNINQDYIFQKIGGGGTLFDHKRNVEILEELKVEPVDKKLRKYKSNWLHNLTRMKNNGMQKIVLNYRPNGRRRIERTSKRLFYSMSLSFSIPCTWPWYVILVMGHKIIL